MTTGGVITNHWLDSSSPTGEAFLAAYPKNYEAGSRRGMVMCHARGESEAPWLEAANVGGKYQQLFYSIAGAGYPIVSTYMGGNLWGNDTAVAKIDLAKDYLQNTMGAKSGTVMALGTSMGGLSVYNYMRAHLGSIQTVVLVCPVSDLANVMLNQAGFPAEISAAYSGAAWPGAGDDDSHSPIRFVTLLRDTPMQLWIADDDTTADPVVAATCISAFRQTEVHHMTGGHNNLTDLSIASVLSWLAAHE